MHSIGIIGISNTPPPTPVFVETALVVVEFLYHILLLKDSSY